MRNSSIAWAGCLVGLALSCGTFATAQQARDQGAADRLRNLAVAVHMYANEHRGQAPADMALLARYVGPEVSIEQAKRDFIYAPPPELRLSKLKSPQTYPMIIERPSGRYVAIAYADGHVDEYVRAETSQRAIDGHPPTATTQPAGEPFSPATKPTGNLKRDILGTWHTLVGFYDVSYDLNEDGTFTLTFNGNDEQARRFGGIVGSGKASGRWQIRDARLAMTNEQSDTPFTIVGETEEAQIVRISPSELVLRSADRKGREQDTVLTRKVRFEGGARDDDRIVGTWNDNQQILVLADAGMAVFRGIKGEWMQRGDDLVISVRGSVVPMPAPETLKLKIELLNDTTLVLTHQAQGSRDRRQGAFTFLRVK